VTTRVHLNQQILDTLYVVEEALSLRKRFAVSALIDLLHNGVVAPRLNDHVITVLRNAERALDDTADVDGDSQRYRSNRAMHALVEVRALLAKLERGVTV
jgi:hypothetical protein